MNLDSIDNAFPLSAVQEGMLYHCLEASDNRVYVSHITFSIEGSLDLVRWKAAWLAVSLRHEALRTSFLWDGLDAPLQIVHKEIEQLWKVSDLRGLSVRGQDEALAVSLEQESLEGVDPCAEPLMRWSMHRTSNDCWHMVWSIHHLIADGWSTPLILQDVLAFYSDNPPTRPAPGYEKYIAWRSTRDNKVAGQWWREALSGARATPMNLPSAPYSTSRSIVNSVNAHLDTNTSLALKQYCQKSGVTLSTVVHAAWGFTVAAYADTNAPLFGSTISGRHPDLGNSEDIVGLFLTTVPLFLQLDSNETIEGFLKTLQIKLSTSQQHDGLSLTALTQWIDTTEAESAFESIVVIESHPNDLRVNDESNARERNSLSISNIRYSTHSNYPLALLAYPGATPEFKLVFDDLKYTIGTTQKILNCFLEQLKYLVSEQSLRVKDCLAYRELYPAGLPLEYRVEHPLVHQWVSSVASSRPDEIAVVCRGESMSYRELDNKSDQVAQLIQSSDASNQAAAIGLLIARSIAQIVGILGILKSGRYYVPLDAEAPIARTRELVEMANLQYVLSVADAPLPEIEGVDVIKINNAWQLPLSAISLPTQEASSLAYVMFTSGSTGVPKGVQVSHENLMSSVAARFQYYGDSPCNFLLLSAISFDSSVAGIYWALCSGGTLVLPEPGDEKDPQVLANIIEDQKVTHTLCLPSLYSVILDHTRSDQLSTLEMVIVAGEVCRSSLVRQHFSKLPETLMFNEYGPTEATVWCAVYQLGVDDFGVVPIGGPIPGTQIDIIDERGTYCPPGAIGEIVVSGPGVSRGYYRRDSIESNEKFSQHANATSASLSYRTGDLGYINEKGLLIYVGRKDRQIKIRGYRIEPAEIENTMMELDVVNEALVVVQQRKGSSHQDKEICDALMQLPREVAESLLLTAESSQTAIKVVPS